MKPAAPDVVGKVLEVRHGVPLLVDDAEPAEPFRFVGLGPQRRVAGPQPPDLAVLAPILERRTDFLVERLRQLPAHRVELGAEHGAALAAATAA